MVLLMSFGLVLFPIKDVLSVLIGESSRVQSCGSHERDKANNSISCWTLGKP